MEGLGLLFVGTPYGIVGVLLSKTTPSGNPYRVVPKTKQTYNQYPSKQFPLLRG